MSKHSQRKASAGQRRKVIKRVIAEAIVLLLVCGALVGLALFIASMAEEEKKKSEAAETEVLQLTGSLQTLKNQMDQFEFALPLSKEIFKDGESVIDLSREEASEVFLQLKEKYAVEDLKVNISPIEAVEDAQYNKARVQAIRSNIRVEMKAYTDKQVYRYAQEVVRMLPGITGVKLYRVVRGKPFELTGNESLNTDYTKPQIEGLLQFEWYGFKAKTTEQPQAAQ